MSRLKMRGKVIRKSEKTLAVIVRKERVCRVYGKTIRFNKKYLVHDEENAGKVGEEVLVEECPPRSKKKRFKFLQKAEK